MSFLIILSLSFINIACAQMRIKSPDVSDTLTISQGEVRWLEFPVTSADSKLVCRGSEVKFVKKDNLGLAFIIESYFSDFSPFSCKVISSGMTTSEYHFIVKERSYHAEILKVDPKKIKLSPKDEKRVIAEQLVLNKIYESSVTNFLFTESFGPFQLWARPVD